MVAHVTLLDLDSPHMHQPFLTALYPLQDNALECSPPPWSVICNSYNPSSLLSLCTALVTCDNVISGDHRVDITVAALSTLSWLLI